MSEEPIRLTPQDSSRKLQCLDVIKRYYLKHGKSPTQGEIAAALGISKARIYNLILALERDELVKRVRGKSRNIMLVNAAAQISESDALLQLQAAGWGIAIGDRVVSGPLPDMRLPLKPRLDHVPRSGCGDEQDDGDQRKRA